MAKAVINPGICGFKTEVEASMNGKVCNLVVRSDCKAVQKLANDLKQVDPLQEISLRPSIPQTIQLSLKHCAHASCPVGIGIIKAIEVEAKLALPADVCIKLTKS